MQISPREGTYDIYPAHPLPPGSIGTGWTALADRLADESVVVIDGMCGVLWSELRDGLGAALTARGLRAHWVPVAEALRSPAEIDALVAPFLGGDDPIFGTAFTGALADFFDPTALASMRPHPDRDLTVVFGTGAALVGWDGCRIFVDVPKNEIQFRARAEGAVNLGAAMPLPPKAAYKRNYFVDWPALALHKQELLPAIDVFVDGQHHDAPTFAEGAVVRASLMELSRSMFRVRPWFEPGPWGGQWIKEHMPQLSQEVPNYAWSFEMIVPENGILFESEGIPLELSFDLLMFAEHRAVLGESAERFGTEFPIRFDFLDTFAGGNLSVQVHPSHEYIREHFGERFTQDETYYILDCTEDAKVYLGFQEDIDADAFRAELERSQLEGLPVDVERHVLTHPARRGDLFLIPHGTIHCSGVDNLVLEISATPYIFTFKLYDWLRLDLDGRPRPINLERGFANLRFDRKGARVGEELISKPVAIGRGDGWTRWHLPTHPDHFYDVHRWELAAGGVAAPSTEGSVHVMSVVQGESVRVESGGASRRFAFAETFAIPAAAGTFSVHADRGPATVLGAFVKPGRGPR
ncbi:class I mannose-6-phosphate isomerase [Agrococcus sp. BE272]|uniref:class I mannose-6-phosphate isomerase n=1 Tax=Agrococcus sp. BE272 TaxID=2817727 RepID=UPI00285E26B4|nr:class I mannose-6-phosphate isomerase [Agrococcus sp. BE272]MDR7233642.1 mannose-6-phosphate isomerase class I [Agrococcus sp. BE272]